MSTPSERCEKLTLLLKPTEEHPWGRSSNSVAVETGVHLNLFVSFLKTDGSPEKWDEQTQSYSSKHLNKLKKWIDAQDYPIPVEPPVKKIQSDDTDEFSGRTFSHRSSTATDLDEFLESVDIKFRAYADKIIKLGVLRPGDIAKLSIEEMAQSGVKKIHARRIKSHPTVFEDAAIMEREQQERSNKGADEGLLPDGGDHNNNHDDDDDEEALKQKLNMLIEQADALGLSGEEVNAAKEALAKIESLSQMPSPTQSKLEPPIINFLRDMGDDKYMNYIPILATMSITRPGQLMDVDIDDLKKAGIKVLHARKLKSNPAVFMDAADIAEEVERLNNVCSNNGEYLVLDENELEVDGWENFGASFTEENSDDDDSDEETITSFNDGGTIVDDGGDSGSSLTTKESLNNQLLALIAQAKELGLSGPEIEAAKKTLGIVD